MAENTKGDGYPDHPVEAKDSTAPFVVREASDHEARDAEVKRHADVDQRIAGMRQQVAQVDD